MSNKYTDSKLVQSVAYMISKDHSLLKCLDPEFSNDKDFLLELVRLDGSIYPDFELYLDNFLHTDRDIILAALHSSPSVFFMLDSKWKLDKNIVLTVVGKAGVDLRNNLIFRNDYDVVSKAVTKYGDELRYASEELQDDKDLVLLAVSSNGYALRHSSTRLKNDPEIVLAAITKEPTSFTYASPDIKKDLNVVLTAVYRSKNNLIHVDAECLEFPSVQFMQRDDVIIPENQWPIVKRALLEQPDRFLNPPDIIKELAANLDNKYLVYAQHALNESMVMADTNIPTFE